MVKNKFNNIGASIINNKEGINLDLISKSRKKTYREILEGDNDVMRKLIYIFSQIRYIKTKTYKRYIYIHQ